MNLNNVYHEERINKFKENHKNKYFILKYGRIIIIALILLTVISSIIFNSEATLMLILVFVVSLFLLNYLEREFRHEIEGVSGYTINEVIPIEKPHNFKVGDIVELELNVRKIEYES